MNVNDFMAKHDITDADLERMAAPYEDGAASSPNPTERYSTAHTSIRSALAV